MLDEAADFLITNRFLVVALTLVAIFTYLKWYFNKQVKVAHWLSESAFYDAEDVKLASNNASYFLSVILHNAGNFGFFAFLSVMFYLVSNAFPIDFEDTGRTIAGILFLVLAMTTWGAAFTIILLTSFFAQKVREAIKEPIATKNG